MDGDPEPFRAHRRAALMHAHGPAPSRQGQRGHEAAEARARDLRVPPAHPSAQAKGAWRRPSTTTAWLSSVTVQFRIGRSKWPRVNRSAKGLAPVE